MGKMIYYAHAGSGNHGCEAIVRSSCAFLKEKVVLFSMNPEQDKAYGLNELVEEIISDNDIEVKRYSLPWFKSRIQTKLLGKINIEIYNRKRNMIDYVSKGDWCFSIGGDNYCYPGTEILAAENYLFHKRGAKTVLWGCSVEPELLNQEEIKKDIASYDLITARESLSYKALKKVNPNTILVSDPAFTLKSINKELPRGWREGNMVGINASPLILESANNQTIALDAYRILINYILAETDMGIVLIPHVIWDNNDDRKPLKILYDEFKDSNRIIILEDYNCCELKGFISRCRFFVGARTHATIAAYSTCVPTLVLGYSIKSKGIARDLFGTENHYVLSVQKMKDALELKEEFKYIQSHEREIKLHLEKIMPEYIKKAEVGYLFNE